MSPSISFEKVDLVDLVRLAVYLVCLAAYLDGAEGQTRAVAIAISPSSRPRKPR